MECFAVQHPLKKTKKSNSAELIGQFNFSEPVYLFKDKAKLDKALQYDFLNASDQQRYFVYLVDVKGTFTTTKIKLPNDQTLGGRKGRIYNVIPADMVHFELKSAYDWLNPDMRFEFAPKNETTACQKKSVYTKRRKIKKLKNSSSHDIAQQIVDKANNESDKIISKELIDLTEQIEKEEPIARTKVVRFDIEKTPKLNREVSFEGIASNDSKLNSSYSLHARAAFASASVGLTAVILWLVGGASVLSSAMTAIGLPSGVFTLNIVFTLGVSSLLIASAVGAWKFSSKLYQQLQTASHDVTIYDQSKFSSTSLQEQLAELHRQLSKQNHSDNLRLATDSSGFCIGYNQPATQKDKSTKTKSLTKIICLNTEREARQRKNML